jgi:hypothetical protein
MIKSYFTSFILILLISLMFKPLWILDNYNLGSFGEDDYSYWLHATTIAFDGDINYLYDYEYDEDNFVLDKNTPYHPPGAAYIVSFSVKLFSFFDSESSLEEIRLNPIGSFSYLGFFVGNLLLLIVGLYFLKKTLLYLNIYHPVLIYLTFLSTLVHFATTRFLMSHVAEFFVSSMIIYYLFGINKLTQYQKTSLFMLYFLLIFVRPSTFLYFLILLFIKRNKIFNNLKSLLIASASFFVYLFLYIKTSDYLYGSYSLLFNPELNKTSNSFFQNFEMTNLINNFLNISNLFFSTNMGIAFSTPVVFIALFGIVEMLKLFDQLFDKVLFTLYLIAPFVPIFVWGGQEVSYGQRLLIGILPISALLSGFVLIKIKNKIIIYLLLLNTYLGYLFFYSSKVLTLRQGLNLWGMNSNFTAENYYLYLYQSFFVLQDIFAALTKNIYFLFFLRITPTDVLYTFFSKLSISSDQIEKTLQLQSRYLDFSSGYVNTYTSVVLLFSFLFIYLFKYPVSRD